MATLQIPPPNPQIRNPRLPSSHRQIGFNSSICYFPKLEFSAQKLSKNRTRIKCRSSEYFQPQQRSNERPNGRSVGGGGAGEGGDFQSRVFVGHSIYKGNAALTVEPRGPEFVPMESGAYKVAKDGLVYLQFAPAAGLRQYDWSRKQVFSLSVVEIGSLISLGPKDSVEFFHDPFKGRSDEGRVRKVLKVEPLADGSGHFFNLSVQNSLLNMNESIYIPITKAEFAVLNTIFNFMVPYLIGWHTYATSIKPGNSATRANNPGTVDYEWNR